MWTEVCAPRAVRLAPGATHSQRCVRAAASSCSARCRATLRNGRVARLPRGSAVAAAAQEPATAAGASAREFEEPLLSDEEAERRAQIVALMETRFGKNSEMGVAELLDSPPMLILIQASFRANLLLLLRERGVAPGVCAALFAIPGGAQGLEVVRFLNPRNDVDGAEMLLKLLQAMDSALVELGVPRDEVVMRAIFGAELGGYDGVLVDDLTEEAQAQAQAQAQSQTANVDGLWAGERHSRRAQPTPDAAALRELEQEQLRISLLMQDSADVPPAAEPYRWSRTQAGEAAERVNISARAAAAETPVSSAADDAEEAPPPPPPEFLALLGTARTPAAPPAPAAAALKSKGFGAKKPAAAPSAAAPSAAPDRGSDRALLSLREKQYMSLLDWHRAAALGARSFVLAARLPPAAAAQGEPALSDWLPLADVLLVDACQLSGGDPAVSAASALSASLASHLAPPAMAALRAMVPTAMARRLGASDLEWGVEGFASFEKALQAAQKGAGEDELAQAAATLGLQPGEAQGDRAAVRSAYRRAAATSHPDRLPEGSPEHADAVQRFAAVQAAYELLTQKAATGAGADSLARSALGYAAWDAGRRDFEGPLEVPTPWGDAQAQLSAQSKAGEAAGGYGVVAMGMPEDVVRFFALRNRFVNRAAKPANKAEAEPEQDVSEPAPPAKAAEEKVKEKAPPSQSEQRRADDVARVRAMEEEVAAAAAFAELRAAAAAEGARQSAQRAKEEAARAAQDARTRAVAQSVAGVAKAAAAATAAVAAASPAASELSTFLDGLQLEASWRLQVDAALRSEGLTRVQHLRALTLDDLLALGIKRVPARLIVSAAAAHRDT